MANYLVLTGGSRGIGEKTLSLFLQNGWKAINISRSACSLPGVINFNIDLSSPKTVGTHAKSLQTAVNDATKICLVHNAAFYKKDQLDSLSLEDLQNTLNINLISSIALNQIFIPRMLPGSSIIYIGSTLAEKAVPGNASYIISKHAVIGLMRATCQDLIGREIRTCCICPGLVDTALLKNTMDEATIDYLLNNKIIGGRLIAPEEIATVIHFCAIASTINGSVIHANLGHVAE